MKRTYVAPRIVLLSMQQRLMDNLSVNNGANQQNNPQLLNKRGSIRFDTDVLSREDNFWDDDDE